MFELDHHRKILTILNALDSAYPAITPLIKALTHFQGNANYRRECFATLQVKNQGKIIDGIDLLAADKGMASTERTITESL